tara:strand:- start:232 stop:429 length:198 start_codon:yes stop_codon:yes gene_type:complete
MTKLTERETGQLLEAIETLQSECTTLSTRVRALELQLAKGKGIMSAVVVVSSSFGAILGLILGKS